MSSTFANWGSIPNGVGSPSGCWGGVSPGCGWSGSALGRGSPLGVRPGSGSPSPVRGTGWGSLSLCFFAFFFFGFLGLGSFFGLGSPFGFDSLAFFSFFLFLAGGPIGPVFSPSLAAGRFRDWLAGSSGRSSPSSRVEESRGEIIFLRNTILRPPSKCIGSSSESPSSLYGSMAVCLLKPCFSRKLFMNVVIMSSVHCLLSRALRKPGLIP